MLDDGAPGDRAEFQIAGGNVRLGTSSPHKLLLMTSDTSRGAISASGGFVWGNLYLNEDPGAANMIIQGVLGVGTISPAAKIEISGADPNEGIDTSLLLSGHANSSVVWADATGLPKAAARLNAGNLELLTNTGSLGSPSWQSRVTLTNGGTLYVGVKAVADSRGCLYA